MQGGPGRNSEQLTSSSLFCCARWRRSLRWALLGKGHMNAPSVGFCGVQTPSTPLACRAPGPLPSPPLLSPFLLSALLPQPHSVTLGQLGQDRGHQGPSPHSKRLLSPQLTPSSLPLSLPAPSGCPGSPLPPGTGCVQAPLRGGGPALSQAGFTTEEIPSPTPALSLGPRQVKKTEDRGQERDRGRCFHTQGPRAGGPGSQDTSPKGLPSALTPPWPHPVCPTSLGAIPAQDHPTHARKHGSPDALCSHSAQLSSPRLALDPWLWTSREAPARWSAGHRGTHSPIPGALAPPCSPLSSMASPRTHRPGAWRQRLEMGGGGELGRS